ncbi:MAG: UDP-N-acetylmuramoyl-tripeptide--D-alanyl-D-alanine ligase [bacterium]|nr:UDP-N-acetylmuramoyl-tripeptide--D-alanyl-D-alanine ligase [bacterium]
MTLPTIGWLARTLGTRATLLAEHPMVVSIDSRSLKAGETFWVLRGTRDGHEFVAAALHAGAAAAVVANGFSTGVSELDARLVHVSDPTDALTAAARAWRNELRGTVVGLTGSVGKTTTKDFIFAALGGADDVSATTGNFNNEIGVPLTLLRTPIEAAALICEMGAARIGDIAHLCSIAQPNSGMVTTIAAAHVETFGSLDGVMRGKGELYDYIAEHGTAYVPLADARCVRAATHCRDKIGYGFSPRTNDWESEYVEGEQLEFDAEARARFVVRGVHVELAVPGRPAAQAALAAMTVALHHGRNPRTAAGYLAHAAPTRGRVSVRQAGDVTIIDDSYNANPASMRSALETLSLRQSPRKIAILGDMLELGDMADAAHRDVVNELESAGVAIAVLIGPQFSHVAASSISRTQMCIYPSVNQALPVLAQLVRPHDLVLVKASRGMALDKVVQKLEEQFS